MAAQRSDLPFGSEFSPSQVSLRRLLEFADQHGGDWHAFEDAVRLAYFEQNATGENNRRKLANNTKLGMIAYGVIERDAHLTQLGEYLYSIREDEPALYREFGRHILLNLHGLTLVQCVQDIQAAGETPDLVKLRQWLAERGIHFPRGGKHPSMMRLWLEKAGIFTSGWHVDEAELRIVTEGDPRRTAGSARGSRSRDSDYQVRPTSRLVAELVSPAHDLTGRRFGPDIGPLLHQPLRSILQDLHAEDPYTRGLALDAFLCRLMRLIDLRCTGIRVRGTTTGGSEAAATYWADRLVHPCWQVYCANAKGITLDDVAREVGLSYILHSGVVVVASTGAIETRAYQYVLRTGACAPIILLVDGADVRAIAERPATIVDVIGRQSRAALSLAPVSHLGEGDGGRLPYEPAAAHRNRRATADAAHD